MLIMILFGGRLILCVETSLPSCRLLAWGRTSQFSTGVLGYERTWIRHLVFGLAEEYSLAVMLLQLPGVVGCSRGGRGVFKS